LHEAGNSGYQVLAVHGGIWKQPTGSMTFLKSHVSPERKDRATEFARTRYVAV